MAIGETIGAVKESAMERIPEAAKPWIPYLPAVYGVAGIFGGAVWNLAMLARIDDPGTNLKLFVTAILLGALLVVEGRIRRRRTGWAWLEHSIPLLTGWFGGIAFFLAALLSLFATAAVWTLTIVRPGTAWRRMRASPSTARGGPMTSSPSKRS